jgi:hypothetical protein
MPDGVVLIELGALIHRLGDTLVPLRIPAAVLLLIPIGLGARRPAVRNGAGFGACAIGLGWVAQSYLLDERFAMGLSFYVLAIAAYWFWVPRRSGVEFPSWVLVGCAVVLVLATLAMCLHRLDVYPQLYFDEVAYLRTTQIQLGLIAPGEILTHEGRAVYTFDQFQSQTVPFALQASFGAFAGADVMSLRWVSALAAALTLAIAIRALWTHLGARVALCMGAMCVAAPLFLLYSRVGLYISISVLHGSACVAVMLWLVDRWKPLPAVVLGMLLGGSLYFYQLSWFAPVLVAITVVLSPELRARENANKLATIALVSGMIVAAPGLIVFRAGIDDVNRQTFDRAVWTRIDDARLRAALLIPSEDEAATAIAEYRSEFHSQQLKVKLAESARGKRVVLVEGANAPAEVAIATARAAGWQVLDDPWRLDSLVERIPAMLARWVFAPSAESAGRWISGPLLNPIVAPLVLFGLISVGRRWREWPMRFLWIWVVGGALLPAAIGGVVPRRAVLALPFIYAVAAFPVVALATALPSARLAHRVTSGIGVLTLMALLTLTNAFVYFRTWDERIADYPGSPEILQFAQLLAEYPENETVLISQMFKTHQMQMVHGSVRPGRVIEVPRARRSEGILDASCQQQIPFAWIIVDTPEEVEKFRVLDRDFLYRSEPKRGFRVLRVSTRKVRACRNERGVTGSR